MQHPETSLDDDVKATTRAVNAQEGRSILVGHSYGGMVITGVADRARELLSPELHDRLRPALRAGMAQLRGADWAAVVAA